MKPLKITIRGTTARGTDAPTVEDLLQQIQDFVAVLHGVEDAVADSGRGEIDWRVTDASRNSPLTFEVTPFPKNPAMNIDERVLSVVGATSRGINELATGSERPMYFTDGLISKVEKMFTRTTEGLAETTIDISEYEGVGDIQVTKASADAAIRNLSEIKSPQAIPYRELGSVEGFIRKVELDGFGRPIVWLRHRIDGQLVKCLAQGRALDRIGHYEVAEVLKNMRAQMFGTIHFKDIDKIGHVDVDDIHIFDPDSELPGFYDIVDPGFTDGVEASEYLRRLREDE